MTSISRVTSTRYAGIVNPKPTSEIEFTLISNDASIFFMVSGLISSPMILFTLLKWMNTLKSSIFFGYTSMISDVISPPATSWINNAARFNAYSVMFGSIPLSKRNEASVFKPCLLAVFLTETGLKYALSKKIAVVVSETPDVFPPNTPAIHNGPFASQIITSSSCKVRSTSSSVTNLVPAATVETLILLPSMCAASKACSGCPNSCNT